MDEALSLKVWGITEVRLCDVLGCEHSLRHCCVASQGSSYHNIGVEQAALVTGSISLPWAKYRPVYQ